MGLFSFIEEAGERLFGIGHGQAVQTAVPAASGADQIAALIQTAAQVIARYIQPMQSHPDKIYTGQVLRIPPA